MGALFGRGRPKIYQISIYNVFSAEHKRPQEKSKIILKLIFQLQSKFEKKTMGSINHRKTENVLNLTLGAVVGRALHKSY